MSLNKDEFKSLKKTNWVEATNSNFLIPIVLLLNGENILYVKLWLFLIWQNLKFVILQFYNIGLQRYKEKKEFVAKPKFLGHCNLHPH